MRTKLLLKAKKFFLEAFGNKTFPSKEEIAQSMKNSSFIPSNSKVIFSLIYTQDIVDQEHTKQLSKFEINTPQFEILKILYFSKENSMNQDDIAKVMFSSKANVSNQLTKMESLGQVTRIENPQNKRQKLVSLTNLGEEKLYEVAKVMDPWKMKDILTKEETQEYIRMNEKIRDNISLIFPNQK